jgi:exoribonuclease II
MNDALHEYLRLFSGETSDRMYRDLQRWQRLKMWLDVPSTRAKFDAGLGELLRLGLAEKLSNGAVLWLPKPKVAVREVKEALLF